MKILQRSTIHPTTSLSEFYILETQLISSSRKCALDYRRPGDAHSPHSHELLSLEVERHELVCREISVVLFTQECCTHVSASSLCL